MTVPAVLGTAETPDNVFSTQVLNLNSLVAGDTLFIAYGSDYYPFSTMPNVTSSAGTCGLVDSVNIGDNVGHIKTFLCPIGSSGNHTVTIPAHTDCDIHGIVLVIGGSVTADASGSQFDPNNTTDTHVAPGVTTTGADRLLVCTWLTPQGPSWTGEVYAPQVSMTRRGETDASPFSAMMVATEAIASSGATGTRTATWVAARKYGAVTVALAGAGGGGGVAVTGRSVAAVTTRATVRKVVAVTAITSLGAVGRATVRKTAPVSGVASVATTGVATARKKAAASGSAFVAPASAATVVKRAPAGGASYVAAWSTRSQVISRAVTAICSLASFSRATIRKVTPTTTSTAIAAFSRANVVHVGVASGTSHIAGTGTAQARKVAAISGRGVLAAATGATTRKVIAVNGRTYVAVTAVQIVPQAPADLAGSLTTSDRARAVLFSSSKPVGILRGGDE